MNEWMNEETDKWMNEWMGSLIQVDKQEIVNIKHFFKK